MHFKVHPLFFQTKYIAFKIPVTDREMTERLFTLLAVEIRVRSLVMRRYVIEIFVSVLIELRYKIFRAGYDSSNFCHLLYSALFTYKHRTYALQVWNES